MPGWRWLAVVAIFSTLLVAGSAHAEVYKWVDENGRVHFGDKAPSQQKQVQTLDLPESAPAAPTVDPSDEERRQRQERLTRALAEERLEKERLAAEEKQKAEKKKEYCQRFRNRMKRLEASSQVYSENRDGTVTYWKDKDADRYKAEQRQRFRQECGDS